ncbi:MAG: peptidylprolyl isomerase [Myxacorys californica WJT36-NPBG1]|jgi:parvulin-like peptidyl-prolyl isomerase|nr:peptidylprolyl isomerase [Myxacorys californica WJT36-NPBG1]
MASVLQVGHQIVSNTDIIPLLIRYQLLPQLCRELVIDQAIASIECSAEEAEHALRQFYVAQRITNDAERQAWLTQTRISADQLQSLATRPIRIEKFKQANWSGKLESHFLSCKSQLNQVVYSLLRIAEFETAQELYFRLQAGEQTFADLARQYSQGPEAETGGLVGPVPITQPHPTISQQLARCQPGQLLPPMHIQPWFVILRLEKLISAQLDEPTRQKLLDNLFEAWVQEQLAQVQLSESLSELVPEPVSESLSFSPNHA